MLAQQKIIPTEAKGGNMAFYIPKGCSLFQRKNNGWWEARIMIDGKQKFVACCKDKTADVVQQKLYSMTQGRTCEGV
jgi:hypothetical protein